MPARKTESRLPDGFTANDLGESAQAQENNAVIVSYIRSPLVINRQNTYVVFVTDTATANAASSYEWTFSENGTPVVTETTPVGEFTYIPQATGALTVAVKVKGADNSVKSGITLNQEIVQLNAELEALIATAAETPGPGIGNLDVARELVNDHNPYYQQVVLQTPETGDGFKRFVFSMVSEGALQQNIQQRKAHLDELAASLNEDAGDFVALAAEGAGVCRIRLALHAMVLPGGLPWTELPEPSSIRASADQELREALAALGDNKKIDLFNLVRFPKSNISQCGRILEELRNRYFGGANFNDVLAGMNGTRAHWISRHYKEGPIATA
ncbi:MAG: hypothetical protein KF746_17670 [Chitinophagaceae bacterium]|nr:hypothetical protein [Chitinophagaceae bacterium]